MYDGKSDSPAEAHTSGMCADLGQVCDINSYFTSELTSYPYTPTIHLNWTYQP